MFLWGGPVVTIPLDLIAQAPNPAIIPAGVHQNGNPLQDVREKASANSLSRLVGLGRVELPTSPLSGVRSSHLSYRPVLPREGNMYRSLYHLRERITSIGRRLNSRKGKPRSWLENLAPVCRAGCLLLDFQSIYFLPPRFRQSRGCGIPPRPFVHHPRRDPSPVPTCRDTLSPRERDRNQNNSPLRRERVPDEGGQVRGLFQPHRTLTERCSSCRRGLFAGSVVQK